GFGKEVCKISGRYQRVPSRITMQNFLHVDSGSGFCPVLQDFPGLFASSKRLLSSSAKSTLLALSTTYRPQAWEHLTATPPRHREETHSFLMTYRPHLNFCSFLCQTPTTARSASLAAPRSSSGLPLPASRLRPSASAYSTSASSQR